MNGDAARTRDPDGSRWHQWDPHIHAPGIVLNNQYRGADAWENSSCSRTLLRPADGAPDAGWTLI